MIAEDRRPNSFRVIATVLAVVAGGVLAVLVIARLVTFATYSANALSLSFEFDETESIVLSESLLTGARQNIYAPFTPDRFVSAPYTPVYYVMIAATVPVFGRNFVGGRLLELAATLAIAVLIAALIWRIARALGLDPLRQRWPALIAIGGGLLWLSTYPTAVWGTRLKPDLVAAAFDMLGVLVVYSSVGSSLRSRGETPLLVARPTQAKSRGGTPLLPADIVGGTSRGDSQNITKALIFAAFLFALAFWTKQSAVAGAAATGLYLLLLVAIRPAAERRARLRTCGGFSGLYLLLLGLPFALLQVLTGGFWQHIVDFHRFPWEPPRFLRNIGDMIGFHAAFFGLALIMVGVAALALLRQRHASPLLLPALYLLAGLAASFSAGTFGGYPNHLLEFLAIGCMGAGAALVWLGAKARRGWRAALLPIALAVLAAQIALYQWGGAPGWLTYEYNFPLNPKNARYKVFTRLVAGAPGEVFSYNVGAILLAGKTPRYNDPLIVAKSAALGWWDQSQLLADIRAKRFSYILWKDDLAEIQAFYAKSGLPPSNITPEVLAAILQNYDRSSADLLYVYTPKK